MFKIEDTTFPANVGIRLPVSQRYIAEELNPCCLIFIVCGAYMDKIEWSELWYFCCRDDMESKKALPFVKGVQTQNVRGTKQGFHNYTSWNWGNIVFNCRVIVLVIYWDANFIKSGMQGI
jgi:hypothetical protein